MKDSKYCRMTSCCWGYRHEILGLILLIIATLLTISTYNSCGIVAMFLVGTILCCYKYLGCYKAYNGDHCDINCHTEAEHEDQTVDKTDK